MKTSEQISYNMKRIKNKDSQIEVLLRKELWNRNMRYRKNVRRIFGNPDIAYIGKKIAIFVVANFGMDMIGRIVKMILRVIRIFGFPKSNVIYNGTMR